MRANRANRGVLSNRNAIIMAVAVTVAIQLLMLIMFYYGRESMPMRGKGEPDPLNLYHFALGFGYNFILVLTLYFINFEIMRREMNSKIQLLVVVVATIAATVALTYFLTKLQFELTLAEGYREEIAKAREAWGGGRGEGRRGKYYHPDRIETRMERHYIMTLKGNLMKDLFLATIAIFSSQLLNMWNKKQQIDLEYKTLMAENMRTRYEALKNQVDPHFLFNTLNTLKSMISIDPPKAEEYTQQLSEVLRYTLQNKDVTQVGTEMEFTKSYCNLMQIRYGDCLRFEFEIDPNYSNYHIIPLSVQTLVENAIKHNVISNRSPLTVRIYSSPNDTLTVENKIQPKKEQATGEKIGLTNLTERYRLMWRQEIEVENDGDCFRVTVPLIKSLIKTPLEQMH